MEFIPGDAYRIDIVGADSSIIVDSWTSQIKADIVSVDGTLIVDTGEGKIYGPLDGNIVNSSNDIVIDAENSIGNISINGDVVDLHGNIVVDTQLALVNADVKGNIINSNNELIVDIENNEIHASRIEGDVYGDLYGQIAGGNTLTGDFQGTFTGTVTGTVEAAVVGPVFGNLTGDSEGIHTGPVYGNTYGFLYLDDNTPLTANVNDQIVWMGGIAHPADKTGTPILDTRAQTAKLFADVVHPDGTTVVEINTLESIDHRATFRGKLLGEVCNSVNQPILTGDNKTNLLATNNWIQIGELGYEDLTIVAKNTVINAQSKQHEAMLHVNAHKGYIDAKQPVGPNDGLFVVGANGWDGEGNKLGGAFGVYVDPSIPHNTSNAFMPSKFGISVSNGTKAPSFADESRLSFDANGVLEVPVFKAQGTTFSQRDSMLAQPGMIIFNVSNQKFQGYTGTSWVDLH